MCTPLLIVISRSGDVLTVCLVRLWRPRSLTGRQCAPFLSSRRVSLPQPSAASQLSLLTRLRSLISLLTSCSPVILSLSSGLTSHLLDVSRP